MTDINQIDNHILSLIKTLELSSLESEKEDVLEVVLNEISKRQQALDKLINSNLLSNEQIYQYLHKINEFVSRIIKIQQQNKAEFLSLSRNEAQIKLYKKFDING